jgi:hypothetical protein
MARSTVNGSMVNGDVDDGKASRGEERKVPIESTSGRAGRSAVAVDDEHSLIPGPLSPCRSSNYGKKYRERLDGEWGNVDVTDDSKAACVFFGGSP